MRLVMTLVVRDEADIVEAQIAYHLNAGVDFVIAIDHRSVDGTTDILESYRRDGGGPPRARRDLEQAASGWPVSRQPSTMPVGRQLRRRRFCGLVGLRPRAARRRAGASAPCGMWRHFVPSGGGDRSSG
jgi:hypothetical protein